MTSTSRTSRDDRSRAPGPDDAALEPWAITILQMARMLGCSRSTLYELIRAGELETVRYGRGVRITTRSGRALIERRACRQGPGTGQGSAAA